MRSDLLFFGDDDVWNHISIHAPTWGATSENLSVVIDSSYFNPRSYMRSDFTDIISSFMYFDFNPRSYMRSDDTIRNFFLDKWQISIHAPTWGATGGRRLQTNTVSDFNPRSYMRSDLYCHKVRLSYQDFNPRSYMRSDFQGHGTNTACHDFNPRSYMRSDQPRFYGGSHGGYFNPRSYMRSDELELGALVASIHISIHAPTWGATYWFVVIYPGHWISIHAPTWGATKDGKTLAQGLGISIHAPTWGATDDAHLFRTR